MDFIPKEQEPVTIDYPYDYDQSLNGIGGWLVVVIIGRMIGIILAIKSIVDISSVFARISDLTPTMDARISGIIPTVDAILTSGIILAVFDILFEILILVFIFSRNIRFRILFVIEILVDLVYTLIVLIYQNNLINDLGQVRNLGYSSGTPAIIGSIIGAIIWISYLYKSERIKNTYIYPKLYPYRNEDLNY